MVFDSFMFFLHQAELFSISELAHDKKTFVEAQKMTFQTTLPSPFNIKMIKND